MCTLIFIDNRGNYNQELTVSPIKLSVSIGIPLESQNETFLRQITVLTMRLRTHS